MPFQRSAKFAPIRLKAGDVTAALERVERAVFGGRAVAFDAERDDRLDDGSSHITASRSFTIYETVCSLGGTSPHQSMFFAWHDQVTRDQLLSVTIGSRSSAICVLAGAVDAKTLSRFFSVFAETLQLEAPAPEPAIPGRPVEAPRAAGA